MHVQRNIEALSLSHCCRGKATSIIHSGCVSVALGIHYAMRMLPTIFPCITCLFLPYSSTLSHKLNDYWENDIKHKFCVLIFSKFLSKYFSC